MNRCSVCGEEGHTKRKHEGGIDWDAQPLGHVLDIELAERLGVGREAVRRQRSKRQIDRCPNGRRGGKVFIGAKFGRWTVVGRAPSSKRRPKWFVRCECGTLKSILGFVLTRGRTKSCGCAPRPMDGQSMMKDRLGEIHGRLTIVELVRYRPDRRSKWRCRCECSSEIVVSYESLVRGKYPTRSCGCDAMGWEWGDGTEYGYLKSWAQSKRVSILTARRISHSLIALRELGVLIKTQGGTK